ncbi:integrase core domain protein [Yersinia enterocolitica]|nr:integrase core domain protein [Yersinia enterocolitica]KGA79812.1 integrase core domain protein [Yersinia enterocolitica]
MLDNAVETLNAGERPVIHSDRGGHYRWPGWLERVNAAGLIRSMSRKGCSPDNAACEGFFGRLKTEMYYGRKWSGITPEKFMQHVDAYICFKRRFSSFSSFIRLISDDPIPPYFAFQFVIAGL